MKKLLMVFLLSLLIHPIEALGWQRHTIGNIITPIYLIVEDLDLDGDLDVAAGSNISANPVNSEVAWFENDSNKSGTFIKRIISPAAPASKAIQNAEGLASADVDKDGQKDVVVATGRITKANKFGGFYWFKSPPGFQGGWIRYPIYEPRAGSNFYKVYPIDANEDTWPDFVIGGDSGAYIFLNPTNPTDPLAAWDKLLLDEYSGSSVNLADVDKDGRVDILNTSGGGVSPELAGNVSWFKITNDAGVVSVKRTVIDADLKKAFDLTSMDITGDGYPEVFVTIFNPPGSPGSNGIYWYENPGSGGGKWTKNVLDPNFSGSDIYTGDINRDGQDDLVVSGLFINKISWFEYEWAGGTAVWTEHVVDSNVNFPGDISVNDFDGDGDMDIVVQVISDNEVVWYENDLPKRDVSLPRAFFKSLWAKTKKVLIWLKSIPMKCSRKL